MIENQNFIVFSDDWGRHPSSCQHLFKRIARKNKVLWINSIGMRLPRLNRYDFYRIFEKLISWSKPESRDSNGVIVYAPIMMPFSHIKIFRKLNNLLLLNGIKKQLRKHKLQNPILVTTVPNVSDIVGRLGEEKSIYYCVDDFSKWQGMLQETMSGMEKELLNKVDLILTTSEELYKSKKNIRCRTKLLTHGVDFSHFQKCSSNESELAKVIKKIKKPIIGFFGLFDERIDLEILKYILTIHPDWSVVILGKVVIDITALKSFNNIHFLGTVAYEALPGYAKGFDICVIPYVVNALTLNINPLKFKEYLATGKPVVTTRLPEVEKYKKFIKIADNKEEFVNAIETSLAEDNIQISLERRNSILNESWEAKAEDFSKYLIQIPEKKINIMHLRTITGSGGGPEKTILLSCEKTDKNRFNVISVYIKNKCDLNSAVKEKARKTNVILYEIFEKNRFSWRVIKEIGGLIQKYKIDILDCHDYKTDILGVILAKIYNLKLVTTIHGWIRRDLKERIYVWLDKKFLKYFDKVIYVYEGMKKYLLGIGIPEDKILVIHNAIDAEDFENNGKIQDIRQELGLETNRPVIGTIGRLSKEKDLETLLEALKKVKYGFKDIKCLIVGDGPRKNDLQILARKMGIESNVIFLGQRNDIKSIYKTIDLLVLTSTTEGLPNTILEAQAMEVPVVSTDVGGIREIIEDDVNGLLYKPKDVDGIAKGILTLLSNKNKANAFIKAGRKKICQQFSFAERMRKIEKIYQEVMGMAENEKNT